MLKKKKEHLIESSVVIPQTTLQPIPFNFSPRVNYPLSNGSNM